MDSEIKRILDTSYAGARRVLEENRDLLDSIAEALLERETLDADDIKLLDSGQPLPPLAEPEPARAALSESASITKGLPDGPALEGSGGGEPSPVPA